MVLHLKAMGRPGQHGCCYALHLREDNARFILLFLVLVLYMLVGALVFMLLEQENEQVEKSIFEGQLEVFYTKYPNVSRTDMDVMFKLYAKADAAGYVGSKRPRWDYPGSFYFVGTVVSTIGKKLLMLICMT